MTQEVIARKVAEIRSRVRRVRELLPDEIVAFRANRTEAEALILNLYLALQGCSDLAMHVVADRGPGVPGGARQAHDLLQQDGLLPDGLATSLAAAIGLRSRIAHSYGALDLQLVFEAAQDDLDDLTAFARVVATAYDL